MKYIKKFKKGIALALALAMVATMTLPAISNAEEYQSESFNNKQDEQDSTIEAVTSTSKAKFQVDLTNSGDTIKVYKIASIEWEDTTHIKEDSNGNYVSWVANVKTWISNNSTYSAITTPAALNNVSASTQSAFFTALLGTNDSSTPTAGSIFATDSTFHDIDYGLEDGAKHCTLHSNVATYVTEEYATAQVSSGAWVLNTTYTQTATGNPVVLKDSKYYLETDTTYSNALDASTITTTTTYADNTAGKSYSIGDVLTEAENYYIVDNLDYGIYVVVGTAATTGITYKPVSVNMVPEKTGPNETWIFDKETVTNLKAGTVSLDKYINGYKKDTVQIGDTVDFSIDFPYLEYSDRLTLAATSNTVKPYTLSIDDEMSTAYSYKSGSVEVQYWTSDNSGWQTMTDYKNIGYAALADSTYTKAGSDSKTKVLVTTSNIDSTLSNGGVISTDYASESNDTTKASLKSTLTGGSYYYVQGKSDVYTTQIASPASAADPNFAKGVTNYGSTNSSGSYNSTGSIAAYGDNRGGYGISVYACCNPAHLSDYQLFLFRYEESPDLYYWYYYRDKAYHFICVDDFNGGGTQYRSTSLNNLTTGTDGKLHVDSTKAGTSGSGVTQLTYKIDLSNYCPSSCGNNPSLSRTRGYNLYFSNMVTVYQNLTGDKVSHHLIYYPSYGASNVFNVTFNVNALKQWIYNNSQSSGQALYGKTITKIRVKYQAYVTQNAKIDSEENTNKAILNYEANATGSSILSIDDTVKGYVYGINLLKKDGDTGDGITGTQFAAYEEVDDFVDGTWVGAMDIVESAETTDYEIKDTDDATLAAKTAKIATLNSRYISDRVTTYNDSKAATATALTADSFKTLDAYKTAFPEGDNYYYYTYTADGTSSLDVLDESGTKVKPASGAEVTRVFKLLAYSDPTSDFEFTGNFTVSDAVNGYTITGIDTGNYVIVETKPSFGYNGLAEDIMLNMYQLTNTDADSNYSGSLSTFQDQTGQKYDTGIYPLTVLNYKGLTLPSTGGMGIIIFVAIGIAVMILAVILVVTKRKNNGAKYYM